VPRLTSSQRGDRSLKGNEVNYRSGGIGIVGVIVIVVVILFLVGVIK
jgi:hypothetical protein